MTETLSIADARKLVLLSQGLPTTKPTGRALAGTLAAVQHLGYIQIDTISVVARAHHHTWWNRSPRYQTQHIESLLATREIFEYWSHAAAYLPMRDYRFSLPRMREYADGKRHWYSRDKKMMAKVFARIKSEGALRARDFEHPPRGKTGMWNWKPAKQALEQLFMEGKLMTLRRDGFNKVYDLAERVLPPKINTKMPSENEYGEFLVRSFLRANGIGRAPEMAYQRNAHRALVERCITRMERRGEIVPLQVRDRIYYADANARELLSRSLSRKKLKILSPFDNLLIQRERMQHLFDFEYRIECYTPAAKRKYGYFSLPLLWDGKLVARMDCKAVRRESKLLIRNLAAELVLDKNDAREKFMQALADELQSFAAFNQCECIEVEKGVTFTSKMLQRPLAAALKARG